MADDPDEKLREPDEKLREPDEKLREPDEKLREPDDKLREPDDKLRESGQVPDADIFISEAHRLAIIEAKAIVERNRRTIDSIMREWSKRNQRQLRQVVEAVTRSSTQRAVGVYLRANEETIRRALQEAAASVAFESRAVVASTIASLEIEAEEVRQRAADAPEKEPWTRDQYLALLAILIAVLTFLITQQTALTEEDVEGAVREGMKQAVSQCDTEDPSPDITINIDRIVVKDGEVGGLSGVEKKKP